MNPPEDTSAASRLCSHCGMCCNGAMFYLAWLQPGESPGKLQSLGLRIERKKKGYYLAQPCSAYKDCGCSVYAERPVRCRLFECQQLKRVASGETTEEEAMEKIRDVKHRVAHITDMLMRAGKSDPRRPLQRRCEKILSEPVDPHAGPGGVELRRELSREMDALDAIFDRDFRTPQSEEKRKPQGE